MRAFIVLALIAVARADVGGYQYGAGNGNNGGSHFADLGVGGANLGGGGGGGGSLGGGNFGGSLGGGSLGGGNLGGGNLGGGNLGGGNLGGGNLGGGNLGGGNLGGGNLGGGNLGGGNLGGGSGNFGSSNGGNGNQGASLGGGNLGGPSFGGDDGSHVADLGGAQGAEGPADSEFTKEFYTFSAPEAEFEDSKALNDASNTLKKSLRVVFVRTPENNGLSEAALRLAKSASESKTAIYILSKQSDIAGLAERLQDVRSSHTASKPDVHFVKYRTPEDAARAQQAIQQQYNELGGPSQSVDGGVAPVINFASPAQSHGGHSGHGGQIGHDGGHADHGHAGHNGGHGSHGGQNAAAPIGGGFIGHDGAGGPSGGSVGDGAPSATYLPIFTL